MGTYALIHALCHLIYSAAGLFDRLPAEEQTIYLQQHRDLQAELSIAGTFGTARLMPIPAP